ncbi:MAG: SufD family Fe-S cluster assembly protein, partial [Fibrobacter sp.]|nr:SufD family Fe-S cluster assembly protein [Fibrobacter sp.]
SPASPQQFQEASQPTERLLPAIEDETDIAALLPLAKSAATMHKIFVENETEMGIIKSRDDFGHSFFEIQKGAKVSLEILDNKVSHDICSERFDIFVDEGADVEIFFANPANDLPLQFRHFNIVQKASSNVRLLNIIQDNKVGRISIDCNLNGENATFDYRSLSLLKGDASKHQRLTIRHNAPNTRSSQFVRNLLDENAYASYDGNVVVGKNCSNVFSSQLVNTILLSESASVSVKPVLKIYHDDVECTHGNTCGELDKEQLFYLTSRGIPEPSARKMLTQAFAAELFTQIPDGPAKTRLLGL